MREQTLRCWEDFKQIASKMLQGRSERERIRHGPIFRGQTNSKCEEWKLESTLERIAPDLGVENYLQIIKSISKEIASCVDKHWDIDDVTPCNLIKHGDSPNIIAYEYMAYLRHNGFPSPLLDWTLSPYVAAYFAFRNCYSRVTSEMKVAIYAYNNYGIVESLGKYGLISSTEPYIIPLGHTIETDRKHYLQQSEYTICLSREKGNLDRIEFCRYEDVKPRNYSADLVKYSIPAREGSKVLTELTGMNITAYALFNSEESLMETLSAREFSSG